MTRIQSPHESPPARHLSLALTFVAAILLSVWLARTGERRPGLAAPAASPQARPSIDLFLLIDDSGYYRSTRSDDRLYKETIQAGVESLFDLLDPERDRVALVLFGDTAQLVTPLTGERDAIHEGLEELALRDGSARLDLAYRQVSGSLRESRAHEGEVMRLTLTLTEGPAMQFPELALAMARSLESEYGVRHLAIAVGTRAQYALLRSISEPDGFQTLPLDGDLIEAFRAAGASMVEWSNALPTPMPSVTPAPLAPRAYLPWLGAEAEGR